MICDGVGMAMRCAEIHERLGAYFDGELLPDEDACVREHVGTCPACASELNDVRLLADGLAPGDRPVVPKDLWESIQGRLDAEGTNSVTAKAWWIRFPVGVRFATAAAIVLALGAIGLGLLSMERSASASEINFASLLDGLPFDVDAAFTRFVEQHKGKKSTIERARQFAPELNFAVPPDLPGGFRLRDVFILRIGSHPGVAARYDRQGEFLAAIFHPPVQKEDFGSHKDYECVVGQHRGHAVSIDGWTMVHVTDPTTCHCVLSRLNQAELPPILRAVAPDLAQTTDHPHENGSSHP